jgi:Virulence activator alpha C-term
VDLVLRYGIAYAEFNVAWCEAEETRLRNAAREVA